MFLRGQIDEAFVKLNDGGTKPNWRKWIARQLSSFEKNVEPKKPSNHPSNFLSVSSILNLFLLCVCLSVQMFFTWLFLIPSSQS